MPFQFKILEPVGGLTDQTHRIAAGDHKGFSYSSMIGQRAKLDVTFEIGLGDTYEPTVGTPFYYYETASAVTKLIMSGKLGERNPHWYADGLHYVRLTCLGLECLFDVELAPAKAYIGQTAHDIFIDLVTPIIDAAPALIQLGSVIGSLVIDKLILDGTTYISDVLNQLVTTMTNEGGDAWAWGINYQDSPLPSVYFRPPEGIGHTITGPPFTLHGSLLWDTLDVTETLADLVTTVRISAASDIFPKSTWVFQSPNPATKTFTLPFPPSQITAARITRVSITTVPSISATAAAVALLNINAVPSTGDTMTIGNITYPFVTALDNTIQNQILIGATIDDCTTNITGAIMGDQSLAGIGFSWPTVENDLANAQKIAPASLYVRAKLCGAPGNSIGVSSTAAGLQFIAAGGGSFPTTHLTGGSDPPPGVQDISLSAVNAPDSSNITQNSILYQPGVQDVTVLLPELVGSPATIDFNPDPVAAFWELEVQYQRVGSGGITVEDTALVDARAAIEHSSGRYMRSITVSSVAQLGTAYQQALKLLQQFAVIPTTLKLGTLETFFHVYDFLFLNVTAPTAIYNGRRFVIQEVESEYIPGMEKYAQYTTRKTITAISGSTITKTNTYMDFYEALARPTPQLPPPSPPPIPHNPPRTLTFSIFDATIANDVADHHPIPQPYEVRQIVVTPKISPITDLTFQMLSSGTLLFGFVIPAGTLANTQLVVDQTTWAVVAPMVLDSGTIQTMNITSGDGTKSSGGVFTVRFDVVARSA